MIMTGQNRGTEKNPSQCNLAHHKPHSASEARSQSKYYKIIQQFSPYVTGNIPSALETQLGKISSFIGRR